MSSVVNSHSVVGVEHIVIARQNLLQVPTMVDLSVNLAGLKLPTPLIAAAGTCGYIAELPSVVPIDSLGGITTKSITREERIGNAPWRIVGLPGSIGMLNAIGLANVGLERFITEKVPAAEATLRSAVSGTVGGWPGVVIGSIAGGSIDDYVTVAEAFDRVSLLAAIEINVSCPNTADGLEFGAVPGRLAALLREVRAVTSRAKLFVKLSPNVGDVVPLARVAVDAGVDGLTLINTVSAMAIDVETREPLISRITGGMSGPAIHPIAVRMVHQVYTQVTKSTGTPIIGLGGVLRWQDAAEFVLAGATAVGVGTGLFVDPAISHRILKGLTKWCERQGVKSLNELRGACRSPS